LAIASIVFPSGPVNPFQKLMTRVSLGADALAFVDEEEEQPPRLSGKPTSTSADERRRKVSAGEGSW
jgi:hypothetical protein